MATLVRLNALRVMAEGLVVDHHFTTRKNEVFQALSGEISSDLMSFFFVLSGFVAMYSNEGKTVTTVDYITKRLSKTFPLYFLVTIIGCVDGQVRGWVVADNQLVCGYLDFILLSSWFPCRHPPYFNGSGWYLCTLYWVWLCFPRIRQCMLSCPVITGHAWRFAALLWALNVAIFCVVWVPQWTWLIRDFPPLRLLEFCVGMLAATTTHAQVPTRTLLCAGCLIVGYWILACAYLTRQPALWEWQFVPEDFRHVTDSTQIPYPDTDGIHETRLPFMQGKFSLLWAVIIQWTACSELHTKCDSWWAKWLDNTIFKLLSPFSLQLYLCHPWIPRACRSLLRLGNMEDILHIHMEFIITYALCYMVFLWGQPWLDRFAAAVGKGVNVVFTELQQATTSNTQPLPQTPNQEDSSPSAPMAAV